MSILLDHRSGAVPARSLGLPLFLVATLAVPPRAEAEEITILRDSWGIPHVFADRDEGAMHGLGYATGLDRGFQMHLTRRIMQGRLAETVGDVGLEGRDESAVDLDLKHRTFGWSRAAGRVAGAIDEETRRLLDAYCSGVNRAWADHPERQDPMFARFETTPEPWTPADCLLAWWHIGQFFATDGTRDLLAYRNRNRELPRGMPDPSAIPPDDEAAVIQIGDVDPSWIDAAREYLQDNGYTVPGDRPAADDSGGPRFSHAWAVGGRRSTTGSTVLVSMPQTVVASPSLFYEFHLKGARFNARGIGVAGSPALLIGFTDRVAWGLTALGADQADLFRLRTSPDHPDQYESDGRWRPMDVREETIVVRGGEPVSLTVRETHLGPIVTAFAFAGPEDGEVALHRVPLRDTDRETIQGALAMIRADDAQAFDAALAGWRFPSANIVFGDREGTLGFRTIGAFALRSPEAEGDGGWAVDGSTTRTEWRGFVPHDLAPRLIDPTSGVLFSANHRPIGSFYPIPMGLSTGGFGDSIRSWRLRELLDRDGPFRPDEVFAMADDPVNPARRDLVRIGLHLRGRGGAELPPAATRALELLGPWLDRGARSELDDPGAAIALELSTFFRIMATPLAGRFGGGESGVSRWLRDAVRRIEADPAATLSEDERAYVSDALARAWESSTLKYGDTPANWPEAARLAMTGRRIAAYQGLDRLPSLDPERDLTTPMLVCPDPGTIRSDAARAYVQFVRLDDPDASRSLLPPGNVDGGDEAGRTAIRDLWSRGELHPAPLSREVVDRIAVDRMTLQWQPEEAVP